MPGLGWNLTDNAAVRTDRRRYRSPLTNDELSIFNGKALQATISALFWPILLRTFDAA
jgi:hypothetical protein